MDKWMDSPWFIRAIALVLAILLFTSVNNELNGTSRDIGFAQNSDEQTVQGVPVEIYYDTSNLIVYGAPKKVNVTISGPKSIVENTKAVRDFSVYLDLRNAKIGSQRVKLKTKDLSDKLKAKIDPAYVNVSVQEKVSVNYKVEPEFNQHLLSEGYEAGTPSIDPQTVKITGGKDVIGQISYVKASIDWNGEINSTFTRDATVQVLDKDLNKLDVSVEPDTVQITVPIDNPSKTVPITVNPVGQEGSNIAIKSITANPKTVKIYGRNDVLKAIDALPVNVDISKITKSQDISVPLSPPDGINKMSEGTVTVHVETVQKTVKKTFSNLNIDTKGLPSKDTIEFITPPNGKIDLTASGSSSDMQNIASADFQVYVDLSGLNPGDHTVNLEVKGPNNIDWKLPTQSVKVSLKDNLQSSKT